MIKGNLDIVHIQMETKFERWEQKGPDDVKHCGGLSWPRVQTRCGRRISLSISIDCVRSVRTGAGPKGDVRPAGFHQEP